VAGGWLTASSRRKLATCWQSGVRKSAWQRRRNKWRKRKAAWRSGFGWRINRRLKINGMSKISRSLVSAHGVNTGAAASSASVAEGGGVSWRNRNGGGWRRLAISGLGGELAKSSNGAESGESVTKMAARRHHRGERHRRSAAAGIVASRNRQPGVTCRRKAAGGIINGVAA